MQLGQDGTYSELPKVIKLSLNALPHFNVDIFDHVDTFVLAAADGHVRWSLSHHNGYGYLVELTHPGCSLTRYAHNPSILMLGWLG